MNEKARSPSIRTYLSDPPIFLDVSGLTAVISSMSAEVSTVKISLLFTDGLPLRYISIMPVFAGGLPGTGPPPALITLTFTYSESTTGAPETAEA